MAGTVAYTPREIQLIGGWLKEKLSASQIAFRLATERMQAVTRNAIIGVVARNAELNAIGFARRAATNHPSITKQVKGAPRSPRRGGFAIARHVLPQKDFIQMIGETEPDQTVAFLYAAAPPARARPVIAPAAYDAGSRKLPLLELRAGQCRFAVNDAAPGEQHLFCGEATSGHPSYCAHHAARVGGGYSARAA